MTKLLVAKRIGVERLATKQEVCQHWMVDTNASCGGRRYQRCAHCGKTGSRPMGEKETLS
jgi:hypothetical protein